MTTESNRVTGPSRGGLKNLVVGPNGLRAGVRLAIYVGLFLTLFRISDWPIDHFLPHLDRFLRFGVIELLSAIDLAVACAVMARLEGRRVGDYGLPLPHRRLKQYGWGLVLGFAWATIAISGLALAGAYHVQSVGGRAGELALYGGVIAVLAFTIGMKEELYYRGYALFTLTTGLGFWPAAVLTSLWFGIQHILFAHASWLGAFNIAVGGFLFCMLVRGSGSLWMAIGAHAAVDWTEAFFYGIPVSGATIPGVVMHSSITGPTWLSGGPTGPEGSLVFTASVLPVAWGLTAWMRRRPGSGTAPRTK